MSLCRESRRGKHGAFCGQDSRCHFWHTVSHRERSRCKRARVWRLRGHSGGSGSHRVKTPPNIKTDPQKGHLEDDFSYPLEDDFQARLENDFDSVNETAFGGRISRIRQNRRRFPKNRIKQVISGGAQTEKED
jgi:hypothetical protein